MNIEMWISLDVVGVLLAAMAGVSHAGTYYVAAEGSADNDGSYARPWPSVAAALEKVGGGHTIVLRRGEYRGPIKVTAEAAGTGKNPTIIKSEKKWEAAIVGSTGENPALSSDKDCPWVVFDGFEVYGAAAGIWLGGEYNTARNCWVHNNWGFDGIGSHSKGAVIESNLIEYNGQNPQFHHGIYADSDGLVARNNIVRHNAGFGIHCYSDVKNAYIANNLVYGHTFRPGILIACATHVGKNVIVNNTVVDNAVGIRVSGGNGDKIYQHCGGDKDRGQPGRRHSGYDNGLQPVRACFTASGAARPERGTGIRSPGILLLLAERRQRGAGQGRGRVCSEDRLLGPGAARRQSAGSGSVTVFSLLG
jgi:hypothetical protein